MKCMKMWIKPLMACFFLLSGMACSTEKNENTALLIETDLGNVKVRLYDDTPKHRDNMIKLVKKGYYNGVLFHRVIDNFMVQTGDPESKKAQPGVRLGSGGPDYTIPAEIVYPKHFHKKGALCAARMGDDVNPEKRSSGSQFYIVTGQLFNTDAMELLQLSKVQAKRKEMFAELVRQHKDDFMKLSLEKDSLGIGLLQDSLVRQANRTLDHHPLVFPQELVDAYTQIGGSPHLDGEYTVFGEVIEGMEVIDRIGKCETGEFDRPKKDIRIRKISILKPTP